MPQMFRSYDTRKQKFNYVGLQKWTFWEIWLENKYSALLKGFWVIELYKLIFLLLNVSVKINMSVRVKMLEFLEIKIRDFHTLKNL